MDWKPSQNKKPAPHRERTKAPGPPKREVWRINPSGSIKPASSASGASIVIKAARGPWRNVWVAIRMIVGPGIEATETPMATASGKFTDEKVEVFAGGVNA